MQTDLTCEYIVLVIRLTISRCSEVVGRLGAQGALPPITLLPLEDIRTGPPAARLIQLCSDCKFSFKYAFHPAGPVGHGRLVVAGAFFMLREI